MSTSAAAGAAGGARMALSLARVVDKNKVFGAVAGAVVLVYAVWEVRVRASAKAGKLPITHTDVRKTR